MKSPSTALVAHLALLAAVTCSQGSPVTLHVSVAGSDTGSGTKDSPLRTIQQAANRLKPGDTCVIHSGTYRESVNIQCSGTATAPIRFEAAVGEKPVIDGTDLLDLKWVKYRGGIYSAHTTASFRQLFYDGRMMFEARWPNISSLDDLWSEKRWAIAGPGSSYGHVIDPKLAESGIDATGATAVLNVYHQFYTWTRPVKEHKAGLSSFTYPTDLRGVKVDAVNENQETNKFTDDRYYLVGSLALLDSPGEWFLDAKSQTLYFYPIDGVDPNGHKVAVKQRDYGLQATEQAYLHIDGLTFFGCGILLKNCSDSLFENSTVLYSSCTEHELLQADYPHSGEDKLYPQMIGDRNVIRNNLFAYGSQTGLFVDGVGDLVENNIFHDFGWLSSLHHVALSFARTWMKPPGSECIIRHNTLYNTGGPVLCFAGQRNIIEFNDVFGGMRAAFGGNKDVSMIYTPGGDVIGSIVRNNWVHDSAGGSKDNTWGNGMGIRGDDNCQGLTIERNVVWNVGSASIELKNIANPSPEHANTVIHNTTFNNSTMLVGVNKMDVMVQIRTGNENGLTVIANNAANQISSFWFGKPMAPSPLVFNNLVADVLPLIDPAHRDFRPSPRSSLVDAGKVILGHETRFVGAAPDIGAYESGSPEYWIPGYREVGASRPLTLDHSTNIAREVDLIWQVGRESASNDIYFGGSRESVESATRASPEFRGNQPGNIFHPAALEAGKDYYWRIDSLAKNGSVVKGSVWQFKTR
jgi:hypothetical protein